MDATSARPALHRAIERRARLRRLPLERRQLLRSRPEASALLGERVERPLVRLDALAIEMRHRRGGAVDTAERAQVVDVEEQPPVAGPSELVEMDEARLDVRPVGVGDLAQRVGTRRGLVQLPRRLLLLLVDRRELFDLDLPLELELPQLDEQLALLGDERLGFALQRADALAGAFGRRLRRRAGAPVRKR